MNTNYKYAATCLFGLEKFVGETVDKLGYKRLDTIDGRVYFEGDVSAVARCNIQFRCAEKLYIILKEFTASTFDALFEGTKSVEWEKYIGQRDAFIVTGHSIKSKLHSIPDCQRIIKKAIATRLMSAYKTDTLPETQTKIGIEFFLLKDTCAVMINTSGEGLYKRGWRKETGKAPMRETLAAALALIAHPSRDTVFYDAMCGSGTIAIEAALILKNICAGAKRSFAAENFSFIPKNIWKEAREEAENGILDDNFKVWASDIDPHMIKIAKENAERAGVIENIRFFVRDIADIDTENERGTLVCNPPYGERLLDVQSAEALYRTMGKAFQRLGTWKYYIFTSSGYFEKHFGKKADNTRKMYNGMLRCFYYQYYKHNKTERQ